MQSLAHGNLRLCTGLGIWNPFQLAFSSGNVAPFSASSILSGDFDDR